MARQDQTDRLQTKWLMDLRKEAGAFMLVATALPLVSGVLLVVQAYLLAGVLDRAIVGAAPVAALLSAVAAIAGLLCVRTLLGLLGERAGIAAAERIKFRLRGALFGRLIGERPDWTAARASGALSSVVLDQVEALDGFFAHFFPAMVQAALLPLAFAVVMLPVDWVVGLLFLVTAPLIPLFMALVGWGAEAANRSQADAFTRLSARFSDRLRGLLTLKLFGCAEAETAAMGAAGEELRARTLRVLRIAFVSSAVLEFFAALGVAGVALYVGLTYLGFIHLRFAPLTLQAGLFCLLMAPEVYQPLRLLAAHYHDRAAAKAAAAEIAGAFGGPPMLVEPHPQEAEIAFGPCTPAAVEMRALSVYTPDQLRLVVSKLDADVPAGTHVAIFGESGVGKSTLLEAIGGLRDYFGEVLIDGEQLADMRECALRGRVALIGQRPRIFHASIADNIRLGRRDCSDAELRAAADRACVAQFAGRLPQGLHTMLGEGGYGISGGEAQRIALARLYLRNPGLILLDEPTAHLDAATEKHVLDGLLAFSAGRTLIAVTHSPAVIARMDRAYRLAGGKLFRAAKPVHRGVPSYLEEGVA